MNLDELWQLVSNCFNSDLYDSAINHDTQNSLFNIMKLKLLKTDQFLKLG